MTASEASSPTVARAEKARSSYVSPLAELRHYAPLIAIAGLVLVVDQLTKTYVARGIDRHGGPISLFGGNLSLDLVHNTGAAFGILPNQTLLFILVAAAIVTALIVSYRRLAHGPIMLRIGLGLILGGALGNLLDRVRLGYVIDFIDLHWWPVFNVADSCIVIGVVLLVGTLMVQTERQLETH